MKIFGRNKNEKKRKKKKYKIKNKKLLHAFLVVQK